MQIARRTARFVLIHHQKSNGPSWCSTNIGLNIRIAKTIRIMILMVDEFFKCFLFEMESHLPKYPDYSLKDQRKGAQRAEQQVQLGGSAIECDEIKGLGRVFPVQRLLP